MSSIAYPMIEVYDGVVLGYRDEAAWHRILEHVTDEALRSGYIGAVRYFDARGSERRLQVLELAGDVGLFGWLCRKRTIARVETTVARDGVALAEVQSAVSEAIRSAEELWSSGGPVSELLDRVRASQSIEQLATLFAT